MSTVNLVSIVLFVTVLAIGKGIKTYTKSRLREIDGLGCIHTRDAQKGSEIHI